MCWQLYRPPLKKSPSPPVHPFIHPTACREQLQNQQIFYKTLLWIIPRQISQPFKFSLSPNYFNNHWNAGLHTCLATCISGITCQIFTGMENHVSNRTAAENETHILWTIYFFGKSCRFCHYYTKAMLKIQPFCSMMPQQQHWDIFEVR
jgi:hypothetical protein